MRKAVVVVAANERSTFITRVFQVVWPISTVVRYDIVLTSHRVVFAGALRVRA